MAKKVSIRGCIGCGICTTICPELFELNEHRIAINTYGEESEIPESFKGLPATLIAASFVSLAFFGFGGIIENLFK